MQTDIFFRDLGRTEALENYLLEKINAAAASFMRTDELAHVTVRVSSERHRTGSRKPSFACELILKPTHQKRTYKAVKVAEDFYTAVNGAAQALKNTLSRRSGRKSQHGRFEQPGIQVA
jgi:ribosomal subunit interface protein